LLFPTTAHAARMYSASGNLVGLPTSWRNSALGDFNHDGLDDLLVPWSATPGFGLALASGGGSFGPFQTFFPLIVQGLATTGDVDGNGDLDAVGTWGPPDSTRIFVAFGDGSGGWAAILSILKLG